MLLEGTSQQPQPQTKQAQIAPILTVKPLHPLILYGTHTQIHQPEIRQATGDQQPTQPFGVAEMAFVDLKAATFQVREKGLDMWSQLVQLHSQIQIRQCGDQINRLLELRFPESQDA